MKITTIKEKQQLLEESRAPIIQNTGLKARAVSMWPRHVALLDFLLFECQYLEKGPTLIAPDIPVEC